MQKHGRDLSAKGQRTSINGPRPSNRRDNDHVLASLRATQIVTSKPKLPTELMTMLLDYLPPSDLIRCARVSRRMQELVYDERRWIHRLKAMGVWNEQEYQHSIDTVPQRRLGGGQNTTTVPGNRRQSTTLFDAGVEEARYRRSLEQPKAQPKRNTLMDGFDDLIVSGDNPRNRAGSVESTLALVVLKKVRSVKGLARQEFGKIYGVLNPFYRDATKVNSSTDPLMFRIYRETEQQGQILANIRAFSNCDRSYGWWERIERLKDTTEVFENAITRQFEQAYDSHDAEGMRRCVTVSVLLDGGVTATSTFISRHPLMLRTMKLANPEDSIDGVAAGHIDLGPSRRFFERLAGISAEQSSLIDQVFPPTIDVLTPFLDKLSQGMIQEFVNAILDCAHQRGRETYLKAMSGVFEQCMRFGISVEPTKASPKDFKSRLQSRLFLCFEPHIDLYLAEELAFFKQRSQDEVTQWGKDLTEQEARAESFFMSNVSRQAAKRDFLSSFKKVVMMPVNALPAFPLASNKAAAQAAIADSGSEKSTSRPNTPSLTGGAFQKQPSEAPTTELAAKTAIMNSRLEGIKSLFSIEVALNLVHYAKAAIERTAAFVRIPDSPFAKAAQVQCEAIFISLLVILGQEHIKPGFDKAVGHLGTYNPREVKEMRSKQEIDDSEKGIGVEPLVTFLELVNVGDLIQQMVDVFYAQELVAANLTERDDFLNPAAKEKKHFEQMLDERVAAGMSKGIDVLMDEVEYICATTQLATDFNPEAAGKGAMAGGLVDIGTSATARTVVETVNGHTSMLVGSTDKHMLDVFNQEIGLRLFGTICKHIKRQRISVDGAIKLISDINHYSAFITTLRQKPLIPYYTALREVSQIYLIDCSGPLDKKGQNVRAKELAAIIADTDRYKGIFPAEEVYEFAERRADWYSVKSHVERAMYGIGCIVM
ncbi:hypothetical protein MBLNU457_7022t1 [Dothideomycetes sp. NU457]